MATFDTIESAAETKVVAYLDTHAKVARAAAWAMVVVQIILAAVITMGAVSSVVAAAACVVTAGVLVWQLVKTRPVL